MMRPDFIPQDEWNYIVDYVAKQFHQDYARYQIRGGSSATDELILEEQFVANFSWIFGLTLKVEGLKKIVLSELRNNDFFREIPSKFSGLTYKITNQAKLYVEERKQDPNSCLYASPTNTYEIVRKGFFNIIEKYTDDLIPQNFKFVDLNSGSTLIGGENEPNTKIEDTNIEKFPGADRGVVRGKKITFQDFKDFLLIFICDRAHDYVDETGDRIEDPANYAYSLKKIAEHEGLIYQDGWLARAESELFRAGFIEHVENDEDGTGKYLVNSPAFELALVLIEKYFGHQSSVPAADRVVTLDHNSDQYRGVVNKLTELKSLIAAKNEYRSADFEDHERRLTDIETTLKILENKRVRIGTVQAAAFGTLVYLAEKFANEPIGELAHAAWEALKSLLGIG